MYSITVYNSPDDTINLGSKLSFAAATMRMFYYFQKTHLLVSMADHNHGESFTYYWKDGNKPTVRVVIWKEN